MGITEITSVEIARLAGVGRAAVTNWRRRYDDFPQPVSGTATSPRFSLAEVEQWLRRQGRVSELSAEERAWQDIRALASDHDLPDAVLRAGQVLLSDATGQTETEGRALQESLAELTAALGTDGAFEVLLRRMHEAARLPRIPEDLADLMAGLLEPGTATIYDPACGTGGLLSAARARFPEAHLHGDEANPTLLGLAQLRLAAHGVAGDDLRSGGLRHPPDPPLAADAALSAPPYAEREWAADDLAYDPRWQYGVPPRAEPELAWVQHVLANLRPGGRAVLLLPPAAAARSSGRRIRAELLRRGALRAVIALPPGAAPPHNLSLHLWLLHHPAPDDQPDRLLFGDLAVPDGRRETTEQATTVREALAALSRGDDPPETPVAALRALRIIDLLDDAVDLTPSRRLHTEPEPVDTAEVIRLRHRLDDQLVRLHALLPTIAAATAPDHLPMITIGDLVRAGAVTVAVRHPTRDQVELDQVSGDGVALWRARDVIAGHGPAGRTPADRVPNNAIRVEAGDVVAPAIGPQLNALVATDREAGAVLGPNLYLLRPDPAMLDPWFLAGFLRRDSNTHRAGSQGSVHRYDIRRAQVPRIPVEDQQRYGEHFHQVAAFDALLAAFNAGSNELIRAVTDGLAAGTLQAPASDRCVRSRATPGLGQ